MEKKIVEPKNEKYVPKTYSFDVTKCDEIFHLLVVDGQVVVPKGLKTPPSEQRKIRGFFVNFVIFWDIKPHIVFFSGIWFKKLLMKVH